MARFYFDFHDASGILRDEAGEELPSATIARNDALKTVGEAVKDLSSGSWQSSKQPPSKSKARASGDGLSQTRRR
jgi:hypothetical protein